MNKALRERQIFLDFAAVAGLQIEPGTVRTLKPPKPDISCRIANQLHYFELCEITDRGVARRLAKALREMKITGGFFSQTEPLVQTFVGKAGKNYNVHGQPLELLAYYDKQLPPPNDCESFIERNVGLISEGMGIRGPWTRLWVYNANNKRVLWLHPRE